MADHHTASSNVRNQSDGPRVYVAMFGVDGSLYR